MPLNSPAPARVWPTTEITLLQRVANHRDDAAWDSFTQLYGPLVHRYCLRRGLQEADACDVTQDVLLQVSKAMRQFHYDTRKGRFRSWLGTVTHRAMLKHLCKVQRGGRGSGSESADAAFAAQISPQPLDGAWEEAFNAHIYGEAVRRLRLNFAEETWRAFEATFSQNRPPQEVAREMNRSIGWVYQAKSQILGRLRTEILYLAEDSVLLNMPPAG